MVEAAAWLETAFMRSGRLRRRYRKSQSQKSTGSRDRRIARHAHRKSEKSKKIIGVCRSKSDLDGVIGPQISIHNPPALADKFQLELHRLVPRSAHKARLPKNHIQLYHAQSCDLAELLGEGRLARGSGTENHHAFHTRQPSLECRERIPGRVLFPATRHPSLPWRFRIQPVRIRLFALEVRKRPSRTYL